MHAPRRKSFNPVNAASLARWLMVTAFLMIAGLMYVSLTLQLHHAGDEKIAREKELASKRRENEVTRGQIEMLTSRAAMQRQLKEGYLKMIPIAERNIVRLTAPVHSLGENSIQPIANTHPGR
ncbi:MAG: hypothetical protein ABJB09_00480 [Verrucomicrobiota bacterium]